MHCGARDRQARRSQHSLQGAIDDGTRKGGQRFRRETLPVEGLLPCGPPTLMQQLKLSTMFEVSAEGLAQLGPRDPYQALRRHSCGTSAAP